MKKKRGQSAIEFLILVGAVLFFFLAFLYAVQSNLSDKTREQRGAAVREVALIVQDEIILAWESSDGYSRSFELPGKVQGADYYINITEELVYVRTIDGRHAIAFPVFNVTGQPIKGLNAIGKRNGIVFLNT